MSNYISLDTLGQSFQRVIPALKGYTDKKSGSTDGLLYQIAEHSGYGFETFVQLNSDEDLTEKVSSMVESGVRVWYENGDDSRFVYIDTKGNLVVDDTMTKAVMSGAQAVDKDGAIYIWDGSKLSAVDSHLLSLVTQKNQKIPSKVETLWSALFDRDIEKIPVIEDFIQENPFEGSLTVPPDNKIYAVVENKENLYDENGKFTYVDGFYLTYRSPDGNYAGDDYPEISGVVFLKPTRQLCCIDGSTSKGDAAMKSFSCSYSPYGSECNIIKLIENAINSRLALEDATKPFDKNIRVVDGGVFLDHASTPSKELVPPNNHVYMCIQGGPHNAGKKFSTDAEGRKYLTYAPYVVFAHWSKGQTNIDAFDDEMECYFYVPEWDTLYRALLLSGGSHEVYAVNHADAVTEAINSKYLRNGVNGMSGRRIYQIIDPNDTGYDELINKIFRNAGEYGLFTNYYLPGTNEPPIEALVYEGTVDKFYNPAFIYLIDERTVIPEKWKDMYPYGFYIFNRGINELCWLDGTEIR